MKFNKVYAAFLAAGMCLAITVTPVMARNGLDDNQTQQIKTSIPTRPPVGSDPWKEFQNKQQQEYQSKLKEAQKSFLEKKQTCQKERVEFIKDRNTKAQEMMKRCSDLLPKAQNQTRQTSGAATQLGIKTAEGKGPLPTPAPKSSTCQTDTDCGDGFKCSMPLIKKCPEGQACAQSLSTTMGKCMKKAPTDDYRACIVKAQTEAKSFREETTDMLKEKAQNCTKMVREVLGLSTSVPSTY
jgi:hypothetical protein